MAITFSKAPTEIIEAHLAGDWYKAAHLGLTLAQYKAHVLGAQHQSAQIVVALDALENGDYTLAYSACVYAAKDNVNAASVLLEAALADIAHLGG